jgi:hypothetical protein
MPLVHACDSSYSEGRDQEDCGSKPAWTNSSGQPISKKNPNTLKKDWWIGSRCTENKNFQGGKKKKLRV